jgi:hypothetical protein
MQKVEAEKKRLKVNIGQQPKPLNLIR